MRRSDEDFAREIESHIALETDRLAAEGMSRADAERAARRRFGRPLIATERFYESRRRLVLDRFQQDVRYAVRGLGQTPAFTLVTILTLAIGIGASTAVATQIDAVFFQAPPVTEPASVRSIAWSSPQRAFAEGLFRGPAWDARRITTLPHAMFREIQNHTSGFSSVACWRPASEALTESGLIRVHAVSGSFFATLGVRMLAGRPIGEEDDRPGSPRVAVAADPALLNDNLRIHGHAFTVVGIVPPEFSGLTATDPADVFVPYAADYLFPTFQRNAWSECRVVARLRPGAPAEQARAETEAVVHQLIAANPPKDRYEPPRVTLDDLSEQRAELQRSLSTPLRLIAGTVGILLIITCANIGGLLFARGRARRKEIATRLALGGARARIVQQLLTESLLLCACGGAAGVALAYALNPLLPRLLASLAGATALGFSLRPDLRVLAFAMLVTAACGVLFGLLPALTAARLDPAAALKQATGIAPPVRLRAGKTALAIQLALSMVVLGGAGLLVRTMMNLRAVPLGYTPEGLVFVETNNPVGRPRAFVEDTLAEIRKLPGVARATVSQWPIFNNTTLRVGFCIPGAEPALQRLDLSYVFPDFFATWGVRFVAGGDLTDSGEPGVIVNETFVARFLQGKNPLGQIIGSGECPGRTQLPIIGVVADHIDRQRVELVPAVYLRYPRAGALYVTTYAVRTDGDVRAMVPGLRRTIAARGIAPTGDVRTGAEYRDGITKREYFLTVLLVFFAGVALFISCLGLYGMLAYSVTWRTAEIGLRMAVGARSIDIIGMVLAESLTPVVLGVAAGVLGAIGLARALEGLLFRVSTGDPITMMAAAAVLIAAATVAAWMPARRACRIDPVPALRYE